MDNETDRPAPLSYAVSDGGMVDAPWLRIVRFPRIPAVLIAAVAMVVLHLGIVASPERFEQQISSELLLLIIVSCFFPIFVQRRGAGRLIMTLIVCGVLLLSASLEGRLSMAWELKDATMHFLTAIAVYLCWQITFGRRLTTTLTGVVLLALALGGITETISDFFLASEISARFYNTVRFVPAYVFTLGLWFGLGWIERSGRQSLRRWRDRGVLAGLCVCILASVAYLAFLRTDLAWYSLRSGHPFTRYFSLEILVRHGVDDSRLWEILAASNWDEDQSTWVNWRAGTIEYLASRDPLVPERLSKLLLSHPTRYLAEDSADVLASAGRVECLPVLMRFATFNQSGPCTEAAAKFSAPQAAWPLLFNEVFFDLAIGGRNPQLSPGTRAKLAALLGVDRGADPDAWMDLLEEKAHGHHALIPDAISDEMDQGITLYGRYVAASNRLARLKIVLPPGIRRPSADVPDVATLERDVESFERSVDRLLP